ncbi:Clp protease N-terminal domain-containing protein [Micromonospora sp. NPDC050686]|uniref:Clp protease N-terminal domain-containing protein n=1 Tax=Micromonospora sp. NPDC050686 TaxID=3154631 RepID=UPI0033D0A135
MTTHPHRCPTTAGSAMMWTLATTYRRAWLAGQAVVCTDHLLLELGRRLPSLKEQFAPLAALITDRVGQGWLGDDEPVAAVPAATDSEREASAILREAGWRAREPRLRSSATPPPAWSAAVWEVTRSALADAGSVGVTDAHAMHLVPGLLADPGHRSRRLLDAVNLDAERVMARMPVGVSVREAGEPIDDLVKTLKLLGVLDSRYPLPARIAGGLLRVARPRPEGPVLRVVEQEALRAAVRLGAPEIGPEHLLVGITAVHEQLGIAGERLRSDLVPANRAGELLTRRGIDGPSLRRQLALSAAHGGGAPGLRAAIDDPARSPSTTAALDRAERYGTGSRWTGTSHLLLALLTESGEVIDPLLNAMRVAAGKLREEATRDVGHPGPRGT